MTEAALWIGLGVALAIAFGVLQRYWRRTSAPPLDAYRGRALEELLQLERRVRKPENRGEALAALPEFVMRVCREFLPEARLRDLSSAEWLELLDSTWSEDGFTNGAGRMLPTLALSQPGPLSRATKDQALALIGVIRRWVRLHRTPEKTHRRPTPT